MAQESLLQMLEELATRVKSLEREKKQAALTIQGLESEVGELGALIAQASEKVDEMLKEGTSANMSQPPAVNPPATSTSRERLGEFSPDPQKQPKRLFPHAFIPPD